MKKSIIFLTILTSMFIMNAQNEIMRVHRGGNVTEHAVNQIDSMKINVGATAAEDKMEVWKNNSIVTDYFINNVDSITCSAPIFTLTLDPDGGTVTPSTISVTLGEPIGTLPTPTKPSHAFAGWKINGTTINSSTIWNYTTNQTAIATWVAGGILVYFNENTGTGYMEPQVFTPGVPQNLTENSYTKIGHTFNSWNTAFNGSGTSYIDKQMIMVTANMLLYAQWTINSYTITFDSDGGTPKNPITQNYGTVVTPPTHPTKDGHTFMGWLPEIPITMPAYNLTCVAQWTANTYILTLNPNGGIVDPTSLNVTYGQPIGTMPTPTKLGFTCVGWNISTTIITETTIWDYTVNQTANAIWVLIVTPCPGVPTVTDCQGNVYNTVPIGTQCWTKENMKATKYDTNSERPNITISTLSSWVYTPYYTASTLSHPDKGHLYNWAAAVALEDGQSQITEFSGKRQGICPNGWHIPTDAELTTMENYLIANGFNYDGTNYGNKIAKSLVEVAPGNRGFWNSLVGTGCPGCTTDAGEPKRNLTGFSALPAGNAIGSSVYYTGNYAGFWSASASNGNNAWYRSLYYNYDYLNRYDFIKHNGFSVRCLRD